MYRFIVEPWQFSGFVKKHDGDDDDDDNDDGTAIIVMYIYIKIDGHNERCFIV